MERRSEKKTEKKPEKKFERNFDRKPEREVEAPSKEAKALSLFLMAYKTKDPIYKEKSKRINKLWRLVTRKELSSKDYMKEVKNVIATYGGYQEVLEKTVQFYIKKTGKWELKGDDKYCRDAQRVANKILKK